VRHTLVAKIVEAYDKKRTVAVKKNVRYVKKNSKEK